MCTPRHGPAQLSRRSLLRRDCNDSKHASIVTAHVSLSRRSRLRRDCEWGTAPGDGGAAQADSGWRRPSELAMREDDSAMRKAHDGSGCGEVCRRILCDRQSLTHTVCSHVALCQIEFAPPNAAIGLVLQFAKEKASLCAARGYQ